MKQLTKKVNRNSGGSIHLRSQSQQGGRTLSSWDNNFDDERVGPTISSKPLHSTQSSFSPIEDHSDQLKNIHFNKNGCSTQEKQSLSRKQLHRPTSKIFDSAINDVKCPNSQGKVSQDVRRANKGKGKDDGSRQINLTGDSDEVIECRSSRKSIIETSAPSHGNLVAGMHADGCSEVHSEDEIMLKPTKIAAMRPKADEQINKIAVLANSTSKAQRASSKSTQLSLGNFWVYHHERGLRRISYNKNRQSSSLELFPSHLIISRERQPEIHLLRSQTKTIHVAEPTGDQHRFVILIYDDYFESGEQKTLWKDILDQPKLTPGCTGQLGSAFILEVSAQPSLKLDTFRRVWKSWCDTHQTTWGLQADFLHGEYIGNEASSTCQTATKSLETPDLEHEGPTQPLVPSLNSAISVARLSVPVSTYKTNGPKSLLVPSEATRTSQSRPTPIRPASSAPVNTSRQSLMHPCSENSFSTPSQNIKDAIEGQDGKEAQEQVSALKVSSLPPIPNSDSDIALVWPFEETIASVAITHGDLRRLEEGEFLNDTLIEFGLKWELDQIQKSNSELAGSIHLFNSFFFQKLSYKSKPKLDASEEAKLAYAGVRKWTKGNNVFQKDYLIIPINEQYVEFTQKFNFSKNIMHWYLMIVANPGRLLDLPPPESSDTPLTPGPFKRSLRSGKGEQEKHSNSPSVSGPAHSQTTSRFFAPSPISGIPKASDMSAEELKPDHVAGSIESETAAITQSTEAMQSMDLDDDKNTLEKSTASEIHIINRPQSQTVLRYLINEADDKLKKKLPESIVKQVSVKKVSVPEQPNHCDCGLYLIHAFKTFFLQPKQKLQWILQQDSAPGRRRPNGQWQAEVDAEWDAVGAVQARKALREQVLSLTAQYQTKTRAQKPHPSAARARKQYSANLPNGPESTKKPRLDLIETPVDQVSCLDRKSQTNSPTPITQDPPGAPSTSLQQICPAKLVPFNSPKEPAVPSSEDESVQEVLDPPRSAVLDDEGELCFGAPDKKPNQIDNSPITRSRTPPSVRGGTLKQESIRKNRSNTKKHSSPSLDDVLATESPLGPLSSTRGISNSRCQTVASASIAHSGMKSIQINRGDDEFTTIKRKFLTDKSACSPEELGHSAGAKNRRVELDPPSFKISNTLSRHSHLSPLAPKTRNCGPEQRSLADRMDKNDARSLTQASELAHVSQQMPGLIQVSCEISKTAPAQLRTGGRNDPVTIDDD